MTGTHTCHLTGNYTHCLNPDIRTRHNDNDDAPVFFFVHKIISVYDELPFVGCIDAGGSISYFHAKHVARCCPPHGNRPSEFKATRDPQIGRGEIKMSKNTKRPERASNIYIIYYII